MGIYHLAAPRLLESLPKLENSNPTDERITVGYIALGRMAASEQKNESAELFLQKALLAADKPIQNQKTHIRNANNSLGYYYLTQHRFSEALPLLEKSLYLSREDGLDPIAIAVDIDNVGLAHAGLGNEKASYDLSEEALAMVEKDKNNSLYFRTKGIILYNMAKKKEESNSMYSAIIRYDEAISALEMAAINSPPDQWRLNEVKRSKSRLLLKIEAK